MRIFPAIGYAELKKMPREEFDLWFSEACRMMLIEKQERIMERYGSTEHINRQLEMIHDHLGEIHIPLYCQCNFARTGLEGG